MGSGMLPTGAYITLEHEYILIFKKNGNRLFKTINEKNNRAESAYFWEERNIWASNIWEMKGEPQKIKSLDSFVRKTSAAYPFELPYRLINMYSVKNDVILDPFVGTGKTILASIALNRNSISYEIEPDFKNIIINDIKSKGKIFFNDVIKNRLNKHIKFINERVINIDKTNPKYINKYLNLPVMSNQELNIRFNLIKNISFVEDKFIVDYDIGCYSGVEILQENEYF